MPGAAWMERIRASLATMDAGAVDGATARFFYDHYRANVPTLLRLPRWPALRWTLEAMRREIGDRPVEVQWDRLADPDYEVNAPRHKAVVPFAAFLDAMTSGAGNNVYMTAQNRSANAAALAPLWRDVGPLPPCLSPDPDAAFVWLGRDTVTPLHHDETNNLMCQVMGWKLLRLFDPDQRDRLDNHIGVHSRLGWVSDAMVADRGLTLREIWLPPGFALFLPVGWWHCVKSAGVAMTLVYTNFVWPNFWGRVTE
jgi:hypothetical protein